MMQGQTLWELRALDWMIHNQSPAAALFKRDLSILLEGDREPQPWLKVQFSITLRNAVFLDQFLRQRHAES